MSNDPASTEMFKPFEADKDVKSMTSEPRDNLEEFDPFEIGAPASVSKKGSSVKSGQRTVSSGGSAASKSSSALPPRIDIKFKVHEEISSTADTSDANEGSSSIYVEGIVMAQATSSDALKNAPFILVAESGMGQTVKFKAIDEYAKKYPSKGEAAQVTIIKIPKSVVGFVDVGSYELREQVAHMPMLLERKISRARAKVQVAIQVRSKLANPDDMKDMSIVLSISDMIDGNSVEINAGKGDWDRSSRTILWKLDKLPKGESFMVSARAKLTEENADVDDAKIKFPVMLRCASSDQISSARFTAIEASGYPATISTTTVQKSFRIVHRLS